MPLSGKRVLVVDDEEELRETMRGPLEKAGLVVETAASGEEALSAARERRPDLVVLDLGLPGMDGWAVLERLQPSAPPVVLLASHHENPKDGPFQECVAAYLFKPVHPRELAAACRRILAAPPDLPQGAERRQRPRRRLIVKVVLLSRDGSPTVSGSLLDMSATGLQMYLNTLLEQGDRVRIALHVPGPTPEVELEGLILWRNPSEAGYTYGMDLGRVTAVAARVLNTAFSGD